MNAQVRCNPEKLKAAYEVQAAELELLPRRQRQQQQSTLQKFEARPGIECGFSVEDYPDSARLATQREVMAASRHWLDRCHLDNMCFMHSFRLAEPFGVEFGGCTLLHMAVHIWDPEEVVRLLLATSRVDANALDGLGQTALHHAAACGLPGVARALVQTMEPAALNAPSDRSATTATLVAVLLAAKARPKNAAVRRACVEVLLQAKPNAQHRNRFGMTLWGPAIQANAMELCGLLAANGVDINVVDGFGLGPLHLACKEGHATVARVLLDHGADVNLPGRLGCTPLHCAVFHSAFVKYNDFQVSGTEAKGRRKRGQEAGGGDAKTATWVGAGLRQLWLLVHPHWAGVAGGNAAVGGWCRRCCQGRTRKDRAALLLR
jgi:hypothetical protein